MRSNIDLLTIAILSLLMVLLVSFTTGVFRIGLGLVCVLFFPGYTLTAALFPRKGDLGGVERLALSLGFSIVVVPLIGIALNYTPWGIRLNSILITLVLFIFVMAAIACQRRWGSSPEDSIVRFRIPSVSHFWANQAPREKILTVLIVVLIIGAAGTLGYAISKPGGGEKFTEYYLLDREGKANNYPRTVILGQSAEVTVGIVNHEERLAIYRIEITIDGEKAGEMGPISLNPEEKWERILAFAPTKVGSDQKVELRLYEGSGTEPYRTLRLWINVTKTS